MMTFTPPPPTSSPKNGPAVPRLDIRLPLVLGVLAVCAFVAAGLGIRRHRTLDKGAACRER